MLEYLKQQFEWVKGFLSDPDGKASSKRGIGTAVVVVFLIAYLKTTIKTEILTDIPSNWAFLIAGILGLAILANKTEKSNSSSDNTKSK